MCDLSNLSSTEMASWVQAVGSVVAIFAAAGIAIYSSRSQHKNALNLHEREQQTEKIETAKTLFVLATNSSKAMKHISFQLPDQESLHKVAEGLAVCDLGELHRVATYLNQIPLHTLPHSMVTMSMVLGSTVRQFNEKVEMALKLHRKMDGDMFQDFFQTIAEMNASIEATCSDIEAEVTRLETTS